MAAHSSAIFPNLGLYLDNLLAKKEFEVYSALQRNEVGSKLAVGSFLMSYDQQMTS